MNPHSRARSLRDWLSLAVCVASSGTCVVGCGSGLDGVEQRLSNMQNEITRLQNQNDRLVERVDAMEVKGTPPAQAPAPAAGKADNNTARPSLKVVKVVPEDTSGMPSPHVGNLEPSDSADDPSPRPVIKLRGKGDSRDGKGES